MILRQVENSSFFSSHVKPALQQFTTMEKSIWLVQGNPGPTPQKSIVVTPFIYGLTTFFSAAAHQARVKDLSASKTIKKARMKAIQAFFSGSFK